MCPTDPMQSGARPGAAGSAGAPTADKPATRSDEAIGAITLIAARRWQPSRPVWVMLFAILAVIAFWSVMPGVSMGSHECYVAETSREMLADGDWVLPRFSGMPRLQKSPLAYWCVAGLSKALGRFSDPVVRMPSGFFGLALAGLMAVFGRRAFGTPALGWFAAAVTGFNAAWLFFSHNATVDMQLTFWCTLAGALFWLAVHAEDRARRIGLFTAMGAAFGMGMLAKMPMPLAVLLPGFLLYLLATGRARKTGIYLLESLPGIAVMLVIWLPWVVLVLNRLDSGVVAAKWYREFFLRYEGDIGAATQAWYYYLPIVLGMALPWTLSLPEALAGPWLSRYRPWRDVLILALCIFLWNVVFFSSAGYKRSHYILPAMPWLLLLLTPPVWRFFAGPIYEHPKMIRRLGLVLCGAAIIAGAGVFIVVSHRDAAMAGRLAVPLGILTGGLVLAGLALALRVRVEALYVLLLTIAVTFCLGWVRAGLYWGGAERERQFAAQVRQIVPPQASLFYLARPDARLVYYGSLPLPRVLSDLQIEQQILERGMRRTAENAEIVTARALVELFKRDAPVYVIATYRQWEDLTTMLPDFAALGPQLLYRQSGFAEDPGKDWILMANRVAPVAPQPTTQPSPSRDAGTTPVLE